MFPLDEPAAFAEADKLSFLVGNIQTGQGRGGDDPKLCAMQVQTTEEEPYIRVERGADFADSLHEDFFPRTFPKLFPWGKGGRVERRWVVPPSMSSVSAALPDGAGRRYLNRPDDAEFDRIVPDNPVVDTFKEPEALLNPQACGVFNRPAPACNISSSVRIGVGLLS